MLRKIKRGVLPTHKPPTLPSPPTTQTLLKTFWTFFVHKIIFIIFGQYLTNMATIKKTKSFGEHLRHLREEAGLTLKFVSEQISIDTSF
jgi:hypothetical protein